mmetsp:Transcript_8518/g.31888  ORF Transcript_8518/g.31888 Transcript_8518/m.31888 type:complete len:237 (-) Transcript_8518:404-1114(-)
MEAKLYSRHAPNAESNFEVSVSPVGYPLLTMFASVASLKKEASNWSPSHQSTCPTKTIRVAVRKFRDCANISFTPATTDAVCKCIAASSVGPNSPSPPIWRATLKASHLALSFTTRTSTYAIPVHTVSVPKGASPAARVVPAGHALHVLLTKRSSSAQPQWVSVRLASSPAKLVLPPVHSTHAFVMFTRSSVLHSVAVQVVSPAFAGSSPASLVIPGAHASQIFVLFTRSFTAHSH